MTGDFNGNGLTDIALVRQMPGWGQHPGGVCQRGRDVEHHNGPAPNFIGVANWSSTPGVRVVTGDFNGNGLTDIALVRQIAGVGCSIPVAFLCQRGRDVEHHNGPAPNFIGVANWSSTPGVRVVTGDFNGNGLTDIALVRQEPGVGQHPDRVCQRGRDVEHHQRHGRQLHRSRRTGPAGPGCGWSPVTSTATG